MAKMTAEDWKRSEYFRPAEFRYPHMMEREIVFLVNDLRRLYHNPIVILSDYRPPPDPDADVYPSQHNYGKALDFYVVGIEYPDAVDLMNDFLMGIGVYYKVGLGIYPGWNHDGFHLDTRGKHARWGWTGLHYKNGKKKYVTYDVAYRAIR